MLYLCGDRRLHACKLLISLSIPQLVHSNIQNHTKLQASPQQAYCGVVYGHYLWGLVLYHTAKELRQGLHWYPETMIQRCEQYLISRKLIKKAYSIEILI